MHTTPTQVLGLGADVREVAVGREHACAVTTGKVWCWGDNTFGQLGAETAEQQQSTPVEVVGLSGDVVSIGLGWYHTCILTASDQVMCWGNNQTAQLGSGSGAVSQSNRPIAIEGLPSGIVSLAVGGGHNCVLTEAGAVVCWGANNYGQTGDGTTTDRPTAIQVEGLGGEAAAIAAGTGQSCALLRSGAVMCWGHDWYGELGDGTNGEGNNKLQPVELLGVTGNAAAIAMGRFHTCILTDAGGVQCVGRNGFGDLGDGTRMLRLAPVRVLEAP